MRLRCAALGLALGFGACTGDSRIQIAIVSNSASPFWTIAKRGAQAELGSGSYQGLALDFRITDPATAAEQRRILDDLLSRGVRGIAISPIDPVNQVPILDAVAARVPLICTDSDAPDSQRACYIGTDNFAAGQQAGQELRRLLPQGGTIYAFVGYRDAQNAVERLRGITTALDGSTITIGGVLTDETDRVRAKSNVLDLLVREPDAAALVGIWSYNGPAILNAVRERGRLGELGIVCFDEEAETLQGVADGHIAATIVQQPYEFGRRSVGVLAQLIAGDQSSLPADRKLHVPTQVVNGENVEDFRNRLQSLLKDS